jgi:octaprenyl-diphosphate synthase
VLDPLYHLRNNFQSSLQQVDKLIFENVSTSEPLIKTIATTLISAGGKRLRALLCLASSQLTGKVTQNSFYLAAAVELIHAATLLHDDVVDESSLRRGKQTANICWGNKPSILVGDFLFSRAFELMVKTENLRYLDILASASAKISEGEVTQLRCIKSLALDIEEYLNIIEYKTATLFAAACQTGALSGSANEATAHQLHEFGKNFGLMYQIIDDVLDYTNKNRGKQLGDDFREGKVTFPILLAYQADTDKTFWHRCFDSDRANHIEFDEVLKRLHNVDAFKQSIAIAMKYAKKAQEALQSFNSPTSEMMHLLVESFFEK